jgi:mannose-6-phosphate isomerase-like protein (cupin superfamily)
MRKPVVVAILVYMVTWAIPAAAQRRGAGGGSVTFAVAVSDPSGAPIPDVKVIVTGTAERSARTEGGRIVFEGLPAGAYRFRFEKDGFVPLERELTGRGGAPIDVKARLTPLPPPPAPPPAPAAPAPPPESPVDAKFVVLDMPAFIEKYYIFKAPGKTTPLGCATGGTSTLIQINEPLLEHTHSDADEFVYVISGQGFAQVADRKEPLGAGVFLMIPRGFAHAVTASKKPLVMVSTRAGEKCAGGSSLLNSPR